MANDWIKMRCNLDTDPAVFQLAALLQIDELGIVGRLWKVWSWTDQHCANGNDVAVTGVTLDRLTATPGFAEAMRKVGWLAGRDGALTFPHFDRHNGQTAKNRGLTAIRVAKHRNAEVTDESLPEKRREEKNNAPVQPRACVTPTLEEVTEAGRQAGIPAEICEKWFNECESNPFAPDGGWTRVRGDAVVPMNMDRWRHALAAYWAGWQNRNAGRPNGTGAGKVKTQAQSKYVNEF